MLRIKIILISFSFLLAAALLAGYWVFDDLPDPRTISSSFTAPSIRITDREGRLLYEMVGASGSRHIPLAVDKIPSCFAEATVATEDARFYEHPGVDWQGILRALWINLRGGEMLAGGSTITQQVARNLLLSEEERFQVSMRRKLREGFLAWRLTQDFSKAEILAFYLNESNYGSLSYGIEAAAQTYFSRGANELTLAECALVAGLPQSPASYNPFTNFDAAKHRQEIVLNLMRKEGYITIEEEQLAVGQRIILTSSAYPFEAPHFVLWVIGQLDNLIENTHPEEALTVRTTLDLNWQHLAENAIQYQLKKLENTSDGFGHNVNNAALVAINPRTGEILSLVGSPDYNDAEIDGAVNMALAERQPGSALKPFLYALAFSNEKRAPWTAATSILDVQTSFITHDGDSYVPANYDQTLNGPVPARVALASSLNIPAVITLEHIGLEEFFQFIKRFGLDDFGDLGQYDLSVALGGGAVRLLDLTAAYAVLANEGNFLPPYAILDITTHDGDLIYKHPDVESVSILNPQVAWLITDILNDNDARRLGFGPNSILRLDRPAAVKTGTTSNFHDNWTIGYTPQIVVGVWAGNADYQPMREVSGVTGAAPIWHAFIRSVLVNHPVEWYDPPSGMRQVEVCTRSGLLPSTDCPYRKTEWFIQGTEPTRTDTMYRHVVIDAETGRLANETTPPERRLDRLAMDLPPLAHSWARSQGILLFSELMNQGNEQQVATAPIEILNPSPNTKFRISPNYPISSQKIAIETSTNQNLASLSVYLDGAILANFENPPYRVWWELKAGRHSISAIGLSTTGEELRSQIIYIEVEEASP